jgi:hypothetical protein
MLQKAVERLIKEELRARASFSNAVGDAAHAHVRRTARYIDAAE